MDRLGRPTINHPRLIMHTNRESIARRFADIPGCVIPRTVRVAGPIAKSHRTRSSRGSTCHCSRGSPVRTAATISTSSTTGRISPASFQKVRTLNYYLIEYIDYRSDDGFFRKYRVIFLDGEILPYHLAIHDDWKVHHFRTDMANHTWMKT